MLEIHYLVSKNDSQESVKTYEKAADFIAAQYLEVPDLQDYYIVTNVLLDGKPLQLEEQTISGLFNKLNQ
ncbi:hypothetical protein [Vagococcus acidifermentans]|uniref:DUF4649 domain-containing protein n=1 Tax=Vagococcus acidifermentans TaxID=564710 RepID=A0A430AM29_9ENTE|nr:hypothetical protein [Vagococcus acidifermentans]RSU09149.1 hypothetical protein CBF27_13240 [Vagococcus acidifermentans]